MLLLALSIRRRHIPRGEGGQRGGGGGIYPGRRALRRASHILRGCAHERERHRGTARPSDRGVYGAEERREEGGGGGGRGAQRARRLGEGSVGARPDSGTVETKAFSLVRRQGAPSRVPRRSSVSGRLRRPPTPESATISFTLSGAFRSRRVAAGARRLDYTG